ARRLVSGVNGVLDSGFAWMPDGERLLVELVPSGRRPAPAERTVPEGPSIQETAGKKTALRTYQDLLEDAHGEALFEHYGATQLAIVDPTREGSTPIGKPGLISDAEVSPDGQHLLVTRLHRPFSYVLPAFLFPQTIEVWDATGRVER